MCAAAYGAGFLPEKSLTMAPTLCAVGATM